MIAQEACNMATLGTIDLLTWLRGPGNPQELRGRTHRAWACVPSDIFFLVPVLLAARVGIKGRQHDRPLLSLPQGAPQGEASKPTSGRLIEPHETKDYRCRMQRLCTALLHRGGATRWVVAVRSLQTGAKSRCD